MKGLVFTVLIHFLLFTLCSPLSYGAVLLDRVVAKVNDEVITWSELRRNIEIDGKELLKGLEGEAKEKKIAELERDFLTTMIDLKLQLQEARSMGFDVSSSEIDSAVNDIKTKYELNDEELIRTLHEEGFSLSEYRDQFAEQILLAKIVNYDVRDNILVSSSEIDEYYQTNREAYLDEERVKMKQIFFTADQHDTEQKTEAEAIAEEVMRGIREGDDFTVIAERLEISGKGSVTDFGYLSLGGMIKEIREAVSGLNAGEVSNPFWGPSGLHIVKIDDRVQGENIKEIRDGIMNILHERKFRVKYEDWIKSLRENASVERNL
ncbi:MAG TPA: hypothetical protein ENH40_02405 [Nitrospirae bacterium]|nr:hypothetical protein [Nitrospirota bacterium]